MYFEVAARLMRDIHTLIANGEGMAGSTLALRQQQARLWYKLTHEEKKALKQLAEDLAKEYFK